MALKGTISGSIRGREYRIEWSAVQSIENNSSTITCVHKLISEPKFDLYISDRTNSCTVGSDTKSYTSADISTSGGSTITLGTTVHTIAHEPDGTKTVTIKGVFNIQATLSGTYVSNITASDTVTLDTIARVSKPTVSASSVQMGNSVTIYTNRKADSLTHNLTYSFGGVTGTIANGVGASTTWTVPDLASKIAGSTSGTCTITCKTYSGSTLVGTDYVSLTLTVPGKSTPTVSASSVKMGNSVTIYTNRKSSGFTHKLTYTIGGSTGDIASGVETSTSWTPPKSLAAYTGNKLSATCTITCYTYTGAKQVGYDTVTLTLTVPDATPVYTNYASVTLGNNILIYTPRQADVYVHDLTYSLKAKGSSTAVATGTIKNDVATDYTWTVPLSLAAKIPSATEGTITVTCKTKFGGSTMEIGTSTHTFSVTVPNNTTTKPNVTMALSAVSDLPSAFSGIYVQGKSKVEVTYTASSDYSTIASYQTTVNGANGTVNPYTSSVLANAGTVSVTGKVTDARGYYTEVSKSVDVIAYGRPRVIPGSGKSNIVCTRCNSDGTPDPGGVYLLIQCGRNYHKVVSGGSQKNYCKLSYRWKTDAQTEASYSAQVALLEKTSSGDFVSKVIPSIVSSITTAYNIQLIAEDDIGESDVVTFTIPSAFATFHVPAGGHGFTLGGYHDPQKHDTFDCRFDAEFHGTVSGSVMGLLGSSGDIPGDGNLNDYRVPGVYAISEDANAKTITNMPPIKRAGLLRVYASLGQDYVTDGTWKYIMQEYRSLIAGTPDYRRRLWTDETGAWFYGAWVSGIDDVVHLAGSATQITGNIYTENGVETCQFMIRAGEDYHVLNLTPTGMVYGKNGKVLWSK